MTIRSGGRARERNHARPAEPGTYQDSWQPEYAVEPAGRGGRGGGGRAGGSNGGNGHNGWDRPRRGLPGIVKFLLFALVLGAIVIVVLGTALRPVVKGLVIGWATDNPAALGMPFVADLVREDLGDNLTKPASDDTTQLPFVVAQGENARGIATRLQENGFLADGRAFVFIATEKQLTQKIASGTFVLRKSMTPAEIVDALLNPEQIKVVEIGLRTGLRLEQVTAKLQTIDGLTLDPAEFYEIAKTPPADLLADYPTIREILPKGASLEGFLWPATYRVLPDTTADELVRKMLDGFVAAIGDRMDVPAARERSFYEILSLASMVEREAILDDERATIAGVFENRLHKLRGIAPVLASDPTVIFGWDTLELAKIKIEDWKTYTFWKVPEPPLGKIVFPPELLGYQTYTQAGLIPGPICTPTLASIDAALAPDTESGYLFFVAKRDGTNAHAFGKTAKEHQQNLVKYGYR
ncbi:MAG TPA: endolytic transglycosylase MltG [Candidatus Limnocylindrales bacterium]|nr:endolytic transglycosylase MltG [Candidatus Limnocylindrales bacterium]